MRFLLQRHFWLVQLVSVALLALSVAELLNDRVAAKLFAVPDAPDVGSGVASPGTSPPPTRGRLDADVAATRLLTDRRPFNLEPPKPKPTPKPKPAPEPEPEPEPDDGEVDDTKLPIDLVGTLVSPADGPALATLNVKGRTRLLREGTRLLGGKAEIVHIGQRHVLLEEKDDEITVVHLWDERDARASGKRARARKPPRGAARRRALRKAVKRAGNNRYRVDRDAIIHAIGRPQSLRRDARVARHRAGTTRGLRLTRTRAGGIWRALGLRNRDVILSIGGRQVSSPSQTRVLYRRLRRAGTFKVRVQRRGRPVVMTYTVR